MKKTLLLTAAVAMTAAGAFAQGNINAANSGSGVLLTVSDPNINSGAATVVGPASTAYSGAGKGTVLVSMYIAPNGTSLANLETSSYLVGTVTNSASAAPAAAGTFTFGNPYTVATPTGSLEIIFYAISMNGAYAGWSAEATGVTPAGTGAPNTTIFGTTAGLISSFAMVPVPEPTTLALSGLGAASLLLFRRRK